MFLLPFCHWVIKDINACDSPPLSGNELAITEALKDERLEMFLWLFK
jgi:hypothetical protein